MTDSQTVAQPELLPPTPPTFKAQQIAPGDLPPNDLLDGPAPTRELIESIRLYGVVDPIVVRAIEGMDFAYVVLSGSRRVKAVRQLLAEYAATEQAGVKVPAHLKRIPARVVDNVGDAPSDVLVVQSNTLRSRNKAAEYKAVKRLMDAGADEKAISRATGLTHGQVKELLRLDTLDERLLEAMAEGKVSSGQAHDIARLPKASQERLVETFETNGKLTATDVHEERQARQTAAATAMDWDAVASVPATVELAAEPPDTATLAMALVEAVYMGQDGSQTYTAEVEHDGQVFVVSVSRKALPELPEPSPEPAGQ